MTPERAKLFEVLRSVVTGAMRDQCPRLEAAMDDIYEHDRRRELEELRDRVTKAIAILDGYDPLEDPNDAPWLSAEVRAALRGER